MQTPATPSTGVVGAALLMQVALIAILAIAAALLHKGERLSHDDETTPWLQSGRLAWAIIALVLFTVGPLLFSPSFTSVWSSMFPGINPFSLPERWVMKMVFGSDVLLIGYLVRRTDGSTDSPFSPTLDVLPALAIFLHEPWSWVVLYAAGVFLTRWLTYGSEHGQSAYKPGRAAAMRRAHIFVTGSALGLTTLLGYVTRP